MRILYLFVFGITLVTFPACTPSADKPSSEISAIQQENPPMPGFDQENSDVKAIEIADRVMEAMGGRLNWDKVHCVSWNFFGARDLIWDKWTGNVRIEAPNDSAIYLVNVHDLTGKVQIAGVELTNPDSLSKYLSKAKGIWINDSYWLVMPFKLKDSGVTLTYLGEDTTISGLPSQVLELTFQEVGDTPENKYQIWVDKETSLVKQWAYYKSYQQDSASYIWPWDNYQKYGNILLSGDRSDGKGPQRVSVYDSLPATVFTSFDSVKL